MIGIGNLMNMSQQSPKKGENVKHTFRTYEGSSIFYKGY